MSTGTWDLLSSDMQRWRDDEGVRGWRVRWLFDPGFCASVLLRLSTGCHARRRLRLARFLSGIDYLYFKIQFDPATVIGSRFMLRRPMGVVILGAPLLGSDVTLSELVTIGDYGERPPDGRTVLGDGVTMEPGSCVIAGCTVGAGCVIGANSVVTANVPAAVEAPALTSTAPRVGPADAAIGFRETLALIRSDLRRRASEKRIGMKRAVLEVPLTPAVQAVIGYRISHYCWHHRMRWLAHIIRLNAAILLGSDIHPAARIGPGLLVSHTTGAAVGPGAHLGERMFLCPHGSVDRHPGIRHAEATYPVIGPGSFVGHQAHVLGSSVIGEGSLVGGAVVVADSDFEAGSLIYGAPARAKPLDGRYDDPLMRAPEPQRPSIDGLLSAAETRTWRQTRALIRSDRIAWSRPSDASAEPGMTPGTRAFARTAQLVIRLQNYLHAHGHVVLARVLFLWNLALFGIEIPQGTSIGPRLRLTGWFGTCMRNDVVIGPDVTLAAKSGIGDNLGRLGMPVLHAGVTLRTNVGIHGPVDVGEGTIVGPNALLMRSVPAHAYAYGAAESVPLG